MQNDEIVALFDQQASSYDQKWSHLAPLNGALHLLTGALLSGLPPEANILCVGSGTGAEILYLARQFPGWRFTAVEPSAAMLHVFRGRAEEHGITSRCVFHAGYLESVPLDETFDAATAILVSHFILDRTLRSEFFRSIARRLRPEGVLISSDLAADMNSATSRDLLELSCRLTSPNAAPSPEAIEKLRQTYSRDVAVLPPGEVGDIITDGGFEPPTLFFQAGLINAWSAKRSPLQ